MGRLACIDLPALPLQLLLRRHPEWEGQPVAVVAEDRPQGRVLWVNERARQRRVLPGMRYAAALGLAFDLCAGVVDDDAIAATVGDLVDRLHRFSPRVEPSSEEPGVFWLDASGLERLHPSPGRWARRIRAALAAVGLEARIVVGFSRTGTLAVARDPATPPVCVVDTREAEERQARAVRLDRLAIAPAVRDALTALGIDTIGDFVALPAGGLERRFGAAARRWHERLGGDLHLPLAPRAERTPLRASLALEPPEHDRTRLLFRIKQELHPLLAALAARQQALTELVIELELEGAGLCVERLAPASPTLDARQLLNLVMLRLERTRLDAEVVELGLEVRGVVAAGEQLDLFASLARRDLEAANRALARVRAELGEAVVARAVLREAHLPEATFSWEPLARLEPARVAPADAAAVRPLVRRLLVRPRALRGDPRREAALAGPYVVSGGWWRAAVERHYHFVRTRHGAWLWVYLDARRERWFVHGRIE
ncbi:MAG: DNA polymerase Y family protein [Candidatus Eiseniibacteriota bacterium]